MAKCYSAAELPLSKFLQRAIAKYIHSNMSALQGTGHRITTFHITVYILKFILNIVANRSFAKIGINEKVSHGSKN